MVTPPPRRYNRILPETRHSVCALDCPDACSLLIDVENGRGSRLRGDPTQPVTQGFLCAKVARYLEREYSPARLLYPQKRTGAKGEGKFARISWDEALDTIASRLKSISASPGPEAILPYSYGGTMGYLNGAGMDRRFFHRLGASRLDRTICAAAGAAALRSTLGDRYGTEPEQFAHSRLIVAWGANILGTNVHLWPFIVEARRRGARFYVIDPVRNRTGRLADKHFPIYPGSDLALALGLMNVIFAEGLEDASYIENYTAGIEELRALAFEYPPDRAASLTGIPAEDIVSLAREYATVRPAVIRLNYGVQRSERGGAAVRAIAALPALTGSWREPGGGLQLSTSGAFHLNTEALEMPELQSLSPLGRPARLVNMVELGKALTELDSPPVQCLFVYNSNPAAVAPRQNLVRKGLLREDLFVVVHEQLQTDTANFADILLPATTFLEHTDLYLAYGHYYLQLARPALPAPGETKSNVALSTLLADRMGFSEPCFRDTEDDMIRSLLKTDHPFLQGVGLERLNGEHWVRLNVSPAGEHFLPFVHGAFGTPSGKCEFGAASLRYTPPAESRLGSPALLAHYPLELVSSKNDDSMNSTFGNRPEVDRQTAVVQIHPADAASRDIAHGALVRLFNDRGSCRLTADVAATPELSPVLLGVLRAPSTRWRQLSAHREQINDLTSDRLTDIGGGPVFYSCLVQVEPCGD